MSWNGNDDDNLRSILHWRYEKSWAKSPLPRANKPEQHWHLTHFIGNIQESSMELWVYFARVARTKWISSRFIGSRIIKLDRLMNKNKNKNEKNCKWNWDNNDKKREREVIVRLKWKVSYGWQIKCHQVAKSDRIGLNCSRKLSIEKSISNKRYWSSSQIIPPLLDPTNKLSLEMALTKGTRSQWASSLYNDNNNNNQATEFLASDYHYWTASNKQHSHFPSRSLDSNPNLINPKTPQIVQLHPTTWDSSQLLNWVVAARPANYTNRAAISHHHHYYHNQPDSPGNLAHSEPESESGGRDDSGPPKLIQMRPIEAAIK